ncbi:plasmid replication protein RepC [Paracoccus rhizosphaerae]|uniref:Plasmid replication protein RepC n=1 Tax=Paracoccus rhizosphaerae TaxID=1133347 RepID=A0ABV6CP73_9RHOB|nr:plasmid replication protein RepC [Paracoccus rhizosphaerae]
MRNTGWRKPTPGLEVAQQLAQAGEQVAVPKTRAFVAVKRVGVHIGLKAPDIMLLDTLAAFTQAQDWEEGQRPIVWPSNGYLMEQTGFSLSALKRHARRLAEKGVIAFKDSPNGKRWGRRNAAGVIIEAYGFDLSPLSARTEEFEALHADLQAERELCRRLKRQITVARRMIRARIDAALSGNLGGSWGQFEEFFADLLERLPKTINVSEKLEQLLACFQQLQERVETAYLEAAIADPVRDRCTQSSVQMAIDCERMNPKEAIFEPHIKTTIRLNPVASNSPGNDEVSKSTSSATTQNCTDAAIDAWVAEIREKRRALDLPTIMQACPEFASWARDMGGFVKDWSDLHRIAGQLRPMIGISARAWELAQDRLGSQIATAAFVLVFEKHSAGEIVSPSGYLRGMVVKAGSGALHLERSFYGRLGARAA